MIVGNKVDKEALPGGGGSGGGRQVPRKEAEEYAKRMGCQFIGGSGVLTSSLLSLPGLLLLISP